MFRFFVLVALLTATLWQSVAFARFGPSVTDLADLQHAQLHWQGEVHHHHDDGSYHADDSGESAHHVYADSLNLSAMLVSSYASGIVHGTGGTLAACADQFVARPALDGLFRPPRFSA